MINLPICIKLRNQQVYYLLMDDKELVIVNLDGPVKSIVFGNTSRAIDNETFANTMLNFHEQVSIEVFNSKKNELFDRYNNFIDKPEPKVITQDDPEFSF